MHLNVLQNKKSGLGIPELEKKAREIRATCVQIAHDGKVGHLGSALSCVEGVMALYYYWLNVNPESAEDPERDRFILSKGHACASLYAVFAALAYIPMKWLSSTPKQENLFPTILAST